jgi:hypothetical protein
MLCGPSGDICGFPECKWGHCALGVSVVVYLKDHTLFLKMEQSLCVMVSAKFLYCLLIVKFGLHKISVCGGEVYVFNFGWIIWDSGL